MPHVLVIVASSLIQVFIIFYSKTVDVLKSFCIILSIPTNNEEATMSNINEVAADLFAINAQIKALTEQADALKATVKANGSFTCDQYEVKGNYLISHHD